MKLYRVIQINPLGEEELLDKKFSSEEEAANYIGEIEDPQCDYTIVAPTWVRYRN